MSRAVNVEVERKFDVSEADELPDLTAIPNVASIGCTGDIALDAVYFDTAQLDLAAQRITLRRRSGGTDAGWHLKLPLSSDQRYEIREPVGKEPDAVPERLRALVLAHTRNHELIPVAHLKTRRTPISMLAADGTVLAEFSDDRVQSTALVEPVGSAAWREWELELVDGPREFLTSAAEAFEALGHRKAKLPSKLARALAARYPADLTPVPRPRSKDRASAVLLSYVNEQVRALKTHDPGVRDGDPDAVHQLRVAARKIRSVLSSFRELTDKDEARFLRAELQWLAGTVGTARDLDVMRTHLTQAIDAEPPELIARGVKQRLEGELAASYQDALIKGVDALSSDRYFHLLDALDGFLAEPPLTGAAHKKAPGKMESLVNAERRRLRKNVKAARTPEANPEGRALHEVRKSAKRLLYAAEAAAPIFGSQAAKTGRRAKEIQAILGEHQDSIVIRQRLSSLAFDSPETDARVGFTYGRLHALEQQRADEARNKFFRKWRTSPPRRLHQK